MPKYYPYLEDDEKLEVTVAIPVFNTAPIHLLESVEYIQRQTAPCSTVVVDDGSTSPDTLEALDFLKSQDIIIKRIEHAGISAALNTATSIAPGNAIIAVGSDDALLPEAVDFLGHYLEIEHKKDPKVAAISPLVRYIVPSARNSWIILDESPEAEGRALHGQPLVLKEVLKQTPYDESLPRCVDLHMFEWFDRLKYTNLVMEHVLYLYRKGHESASSVGIGTEKTKEYANVQCYSVGCPNFELNCYRQAARLTVEEGMKNAVFDHATWM